MRDELVPVWERAQAALPPRCKLIELTSEYYLLRTPWRLSFTISESGMGIASRCCGEMVRGWGDEPRVCQKCSKPVPLAPATPKGAGWLEAQAWMEEVLALAGADVLTAVLGAAIVPDLQALARAPHRLQGVPVDALRVR